MENNQWRVWLPLLMAACVVAGMIAGIRIIPHHISPVLNHRSNSVHHESKRLSEILMYVQSRYVDDVSVKDLLDAASIALLKELDPHSSFIHRSELQMVNEQLDGNFEGIGIEFMIIHDTLVVVSTISGGPSEMAGILPGDRIVAVNDSVLAGKSLTNNDVFSSLRGKKGSSVNLDILRPGLGEPLQFMITRDAIPIRSLDAAFMIDDNTGYIKINRFSANTYQEVMESLELMIESQGMKHLILDLRHNPGGYLSQATQLLSQIFHEKNKLLVYTKGRNHHRSEYETTGRNFFDIEKVAVLIDEGSASASEIIAGAIQDWDRGLIIGRRSFGKGLVQEQLYLSDGSALRLTIARYYTPSGRSIQKPYESVDYGNDIENRLNNGELHGLSQMHVQDSTRFFTKIERRVVYGGGGIIPDVHVPLDEIYLNKDFISGRSRITSFLFSNRFSLDEIRTNYPVPSGFMDRFNPETHQILEQFYAFAEFSTANPEVREKLARQLKLNLARVLYGHEAYFRLHIQGDPFVSEALQYIRQPNATLSSYIVQ